MFYVYILYSKTIDKFYVGSTSNLNNRIFRHNEGKSLYTRSGRPWELIFSFACNTRSEARSIENHIKRMKSRTYIQNIVSQKIDLNLILKR